MNAGMILAVRARWLDTWLEGLDKSYRLHKWLGITTVHPVRALCSRRSWP